MSWFDDLIFELVADGHCRIMPDGSLGKPGCAARLDLSDVVFDPDPPDPGEWHRVKVMLLATLEQPALFAGKAVERPPVRRFRRPAWWTFGHDDWTVRGD